MLGRKVRCPGCAQPFVVEEVVLDLADLELAAFGTPSATPVAAQQPARAAATYAPYAPPGAAPPAYAPPARPRPKRSLTVKDRYTRDVSRQQAVRLGQGMVSAAALALVLPFAGLQLRVIHELSTQFGAATASVAVVMMLGGVAFWVMGATETGATALMHSLKWAKRILLGLLILLALLIGLTIVLALAVSWATHGAR